jgi:hypothetical protein
MFTLDDTFFEDFYYKPQIDFYLKIIFYVFGVFLFLEILRTQIPEIEILQLVPGFYFFCFFFLFLFLIFISDFFFRIPKDLDATKAYGTKMFFKMEYFILYKLSIFFVTLLLFTVLNSVIPLSLDSFRSSGEKTLENTWSLSEVIGLEIVLLFILLVISQIPLFFLIAFNSSRLTAIVSRYWRILSFVITILAGFLTPTLDGYTQISFAGSTFLFYLLIINFLQKKSLVKFNSFLAYGL